jgi:GNAT superfamily N-acetyltransferase
MNEKIKFEVLSSSNWPQFEELMGEKGGCGGCWCMVFRLPAKEFEVNKFAGNKRRLKDIVDAGRPTGLLAIIDKQPVGWIAFAPREDYIKIENSRSLKRIDEKPVWSITCFFIKREFRKQGFSAKLIAGVVGYARKKKIRTLEAYPVIPYADKVSAPFLWTGVLSAFLENDFTIVQMNGKSKAMVRLEVGC